jgi:PEP-CTERM motif
MTKNLKLPLTLVALAATPVFATPYTLTLTGVGDGANNGSVYYDPYVGTITNSSGQVIYSGYLICDDFGDQSVVGTSWGATETSAGALNGSEQFVGDSYTLGGTTYNTQQMYDAVAYLANELLQPTNVGNGTNQGNLSFAIWDITDGAAASGAIQSDIEAAFAAVNGGYVGSNVDVYTPDPLHTSQEFLVVDAPPSVPEPSILGLFGLGLATLGWAAVRRRSRRLSALIHGA